MAFRFRAILRGAEEVPPVRTNATGTTSFQLSQNGQRLDFRLVVNNLRNFTQGHIHVGARGVNGPVVVFLFGPVTRGISVNRGVVTGSITRADLVGPLQGRPLSDLIRLMNNGRTYVNAHTTQNPGGEIRGQIRRALRRNKR
ncbi:CHRD domain-containing protein [Brevibacillus fortis]|uniref:CHRD domain-containing protein n=1 Tax=Brevibacillus fortis TaxID=2126352 RepID=A0A2P7UYX7_9BACL|nr:CHRD domain-containing protein [Brevibacillus fortis]MED1782645.1 CHRD domain-containing protein [Brevibacillus fortis]PSJ92156.1 CHRD domain-containing protein [Brevibacillus fortis]